MFLNAWGSHSPVNLPERRVDQQRSPAEPESNITELRPADRAGRTGNELRPAPLKAHELEIQNTDPAFWTELNSTIDEFFAVLSQSRARLSELSTEIIKRDAKITLLEAQNVALKARLGIADSERRSPSTDGTLLDPPGSPAIPPSDRQQGRSIWHKLTNLERGDA